MTANGNITTITLKAIRKMQEHRMRPHFADENQYDLPLSDASLPSSLHAMSHTAEGH